MGANLNLNDEYKKLMNDLKEEFKTLTKNLLEERALLAYDELIGEKARCKNLKNSFEKVSDLYLNSRQFLKSLGYSICSDCAKWRKEED